MSISKTKQSFKRNEEFLKNEQHHAHIINKEERPDRVESVRVIEHTKHKEIAKEMRHGE